MFNDFFIQYLQRVLELTDNYNGNRSLQDIDICSEEIFEVLISLDPNKASGIDNISPKILKIIRYVCAFPLSGPICHLFQQCISQSYLPQEWRIHCIIPIYKSRDKSDYHLVSLVVMLYF